MRGPVSGAEALGYTGGGERGRGGGEGGGGGGGGGGGIHTSVRNRLTYLGLAFSAVFPLVAALSFSFSASLSFSPGFVRLLRA